MRIELTKPINGLQNEKITAIELREPKWGDLVELGVPAVWVRLGNGGGFEQINDEAIRQWVERLSPISPLLLESLCLADALALREGVLDFFREAATLKSKISSASSASSSLGSDGRQPSSGT